MGTEYFQLLLKFEDQSIQGILHNQIRTEKNDRVQMHESLEEQYAEDPLAIVLLVSLTVEVSKSVGKETVKWFFEYLKKKLKEQKIEKKKNKEIKILIQVEDKHFEFIYNLNTEKYYVKEV